MIRVAEHIYSRKKLFAYGTCVGVLAGMFNAFFPLIDFSMRASFFGWLRPIFGIKPPYFYTTFTEKIPRGQFMVITLAPLVVLNIIFIGLFATGFLRVFTYFCLLVNTIGAMGDLWIILKLSGHDRGTLIQDTKNGIEVWNKARG